MDPTRPPPPFVKALSFAGVGDDGDSEERRDRTRSLGATEGTTIPPSDSSGESSCSSSPGLEPSFPLTPRSFVRQFIGKDDPQNLADHLKSLEASLSLYLQDKSNENKEALTLQVQKIRQAAYQILNDKEKSDSEKAAEVEGYLVELIYGKMQDKSLIESLFTGSNHPISYVDAFVDAIKCEDNSTFFQKSIDSEIKNATTATDFRGNEFHTLFVASYFRYLMRDDLLKIHQMITKAHGHKTRSHSFKKHSEKTHAKSPRFHSKCKKLFEKTTQLILQSEQFKEKVQPWIHYRYRVLQTKFPLEAEQETGALLFLRMICKNLFIEGKELKDKQFAQIIQKVESNSEFNESHTMRGANKVVKELRPLYETFIRTLISTEAHGYEKQKRTRHPILDKAP